jgi:CHAD domain-containing protein
MAASPAPDESLRFTLADPADLPGLLDGLTARLRLEADPDVAVRRTLLDTFDWRIWSAGGLLELTPAVPSRSRTRPGTPASLVWRSRTDGDVVATFPGDPVPRFVWDLPPGPDVDRLTKVVEMRALEPLVAVRGTRTVRRLLDDERKTVARLVVERLRVEGGAPLPVLVEVQPVRGYERDARRVAKVLAGQVTLTPGGPETAEAALRLAGHTPGDYASKLKLRLDHDADAVRTWSEVLRTLLHAMEVNEAGTIEDRDSEFLHDYRVAVRRTRSVLSQGRDVLDPAPLARFRDGFKWLGTATSPTRDLDVWLLTLPELATGLDESLRGELEPLRALLARHQRTAQRRLVRDLATDRYATLLADYRAWLDDPGGDAQATPDARRAAPAVAGQRIAKAYRRVVRDGRRIDDASPPESLHELRKDAKRLRYALECFGSLFPAEQVQPLVRDLKSLQDCLGEFQDCEVQATSLRGYADELAAKGAGAGPLLAMGALVEQLAERQHAARSAFHDRFARFDTPANGTLVKRTFAAAPDRPADGSGSGS